MGAIWTPKSENPLALYDGDFVEITGAGVSKWYDQGASGDLNRHAAQTVDGTRPIYTTTDADFNNHGSLVFSNKRLITGTFSIAPTQPTTIYLVTKPTVAATGLVLDGLTISRTFIYASTTNMCFGAAIQVNGTNNFNNSKVVYCAIANKTTSAQYINNSIQADAVGAIGEGNSLGLSIGADYNSANYYNGKIAFLAIFPGAHDVQTRRRIMRYLGDKYGIAVDKPIAEYDASPSGVRIFTGNKVDRLWNKSGIVEANKDAVQNTEALMPAWTTSDPDFNGEGSLTFSSAQVITTGTFASAPVQPLTYYSVFKTPDIANPHYVADGLAAGNRIVVGTLSGTGVHSTYAGTQISGAVGLANIPIVDCSIFNAASSVVGVNNSTGYTTATPGAQVPLGLNIGNSYGSGAGLGKLAYLAVYQGAHDATQRQEIMSTLSAKYGPPLNLLARYDGDTVVTVGSKVSQWTDIGNSGDNTNRHALQGTDANRPTYLASDPDFNGHGSLSFLAANSQWLKSTGAFTGTVPVTYYIVTKLGLSASSLYLIDSTGGRHAIVHTTGGVISPYGGAAGLSTPAAAPALTPIIVGVEFNGTNSKIFVSSATNVYVGDAGSPVSSDIIIGAYTTTVSGFLTGKIARIDVYSGSHDVDTRTRIMNELATKYNITLDEQSPILDASRNVLVTGQGVSRWGDQSRANDLMKHALQTTDSRRPPYISSDPDFNGKGSIGPFSSANMVLTTGSWAKAISQPITEVLVIKLPDPIISGAWIVCNNAAGAYCGIYTSGSKLTMYAGIGVSTTLDMKPGALLIIVVEYAGTASKMFVNDAVVAACSGNAGTGGATGRAFGNAPTFSQQFGGKIAYYTNFPRTLSAEERITLMANLKATYKPWEPLDESPLAYYDGDVVVQSGNLVSQWTDRGPSLDTNRNATAAGAARPTWIQNDPEFGGHGSITGGAGKLMQTGVFTSAMAYPVTVYSITKPAGGGTEIFLDGITLAAGRIVSWFNPDRSPSINGNVTTLNGVIPVVGQNTYIRCDIFNSANSSITLNGSVNNITGNSGSPTATGLSLFANQVNAGNFLGKMAMLAVFSGVHSPELRARIMNWLSVRYNIQIDVPIVKYEPSPNGVRLYDATHIDRLYNQSVGTAETAKDAVQNTPASMPTWIENDPDFNWKGSLQGGAGMFTGTFATPVPIVSTHYCVIKMPPSTTVGVEVDGLTGGVYRQLLYVNAAGILATEGGPGLTAGFTPNKVSVVATVFNSTDSMLCIDRATNTASTASITMKSPSTGLAIGAQFDGTTPWLGKIAHHSVYPGAHDFTTRERIMKQLGEQFNVHIYSPLDNMPLAYYDADYVRKYSATQVDRLYSLDDSGDINKYAKQDTAGNMPTFIDNDPDFGGHRSLTFTGAMVLKTNSFLSVITQPITYYAVWKSPIAKTANCTVFDGFDGTNRHALYHSLTSGYTGILAGLSLANTTDGSGVSLVDCFTVNGASSAVYSNNATTATISGNAGAYTSAGLNIGNNYVGNTACGKAAFIAIYSGAHDAVTRTRIMKYLGAKYGITVA